MELYLIDKHKPLLNSAGEMERITKHLREQKGTRNDHALYLEYLETKDFKNLYDE